MVDLFRMVNEVHDEQSFIAFLSALSNDKADEDAKEKICPSNPYGPGANGWEHGTIDAFLEAASAWASNSINGLRSYQKPENVWTRCAQILYMGKIYE